MLNKKNVLTALSTLFVLVLGLASTAGAYIVPSQRSVSTGLAVTTNSNSRIFPLYWPETTRVLQDLKVVFETPDNQLRLASWKAGRVLDANSGVALRNDRTGQDIPADTVHHVSSFFYAATRFLLIGYKDGTVDTCFVRVPGGVVTGFWCNQLSDSTGELVTVSGNAAPTVFMTKGLRYPVLLVGSEEGHLRMYWFNSDLKAVPKGYLSDVSGFPIGFGSSPNIGVWDLNLDASPELVISNGEGELFMCIGGTRNCFSFIDYNSTSFGPVVLNRRGVSVFNDLDWTQVPELYVGGDYNEIDIYR
jgi:hypothetical protein